VARIEDHPETYEDLNDQLTRLFECPVCFEHIVPPIFQCLLGHLICNKCVLMCENCPTCRNPFNSKRNLYMEKVNKHFIDFNAIAIVFNNANILFLRLVIW